MVLDALEQYLAQPHSKPQLIVVGTYGPHFPYVAPPELFLKYLKTAQLPATWQGNEPWLNAQQRNLQEPNTRAEIVLACQAAYKGLVEHTDGLIGRARAAFAAAAARRVDFSAAEALQKRHAAAAAVLAKAEIATGGDDRERYRDYPSAAKEAPQYCVTNLTSAPGKSQTYEFYGLPDVNN